MAALTLPSLIANNKKKELQAGLNKGYSVLQQSLQMYQKDNGEPLTSLNCERRTFKTLIMKYYNSAKDCGFGTELTSCVMNSSIDVDNVRNTKYMTYNKKAVATPNVLDDGQFVTLDGMLILIENNVPPTLYISIDVNGFSKGPNAWGWDLFTFQLMPDGKLLPMGADGTSYSGNSYCSYSGSGGLNGIACTNMAMYDKDYWK